MLRVLDGALAPRAQPLGYWSEDVTMTRMCEPSPTGIHQLTPMSLRDCRALPNDRRNGN